MTIQNAFDLAIQRHQAGRIAEAEALYRQILAVQPDHADALHLLGAIALTTGHCEQALPLISRAIAIAPAQAVYHSNLGETFRRLGRLDEAIAALRRALALQPDFPDALNNLGSALAHREQWHEAVECFRRAAMLAPENADAWSNLSLALSKQGRWTESAECDRRVVALRPASAEAHHQLGHALLLTGHWEEAVACCRRAVALRPDYVEAFNNLGTSLGALGRFDEARAALQRALDLQPGCAATHHNIGNMLRDRGDLDEAIAAARRALALDPNHPGIHSNLLFALHFQPHCDARSIAEEHRRWAQAHAEPLGTFILPHDNDRAPGRRLRVGYVSSDFRGHSVAVFMEGLLAGHDPVQVEVFCYADLACEDAVSERLKARAAHWRRITGLSDEQVAALIRTDAIDILVDLAGHTSGNRLLVFARKPAPVQITYLGYCDPTGMSAMDYRLTDAHADPPGATEDLHTERLVRLSGTAWCFRAPEPSPPVAPSPALDAGHVTFGCFNARPKMNDEIFALWARVVRAVPGSRLLLKNGGLRDADVARYVRDFFTRAGIAPERIELLGWLPAPADHLAAYDRVDIALDTFPYHGTTTTCEALWMGVPVVTLAGRTHAARVAVSLLQNVGLPEFVAQTGNDYARLATEIAADLPRLAALRKSLRPRMQASVLMDAPRFTRAVEAAYREMWEKWCANSAKRGHGSTFHVPPRGIENTERTPRQMP